MNPYAKHLGERDPLAVIERTPATLRSILDSLPPDRVDAAPAPGKWSVRHILAHLADTEIVFAFRLRQAMAENYHVIQPFDQERWADNYPAYSAEAALDVFTTVRSWNLQFIRHVPKDRFTKRLTHPERGEMTFQVVIETMGGHDLNHLAQLEGYA